MRSPAARAWQTARKPEQGTGRGGQRRQGSNTKGAKRPAARAREGKGFWTSLESSWQQGGWFGALGGALTLCPAAVTPQGESRLLQVAAIDPVTFPLHRRATLARMDPGTSGAAPGAWLTRSNPPPSILWQLFPTPEPGRGGKASPLASHCLPAPGLPPWLSHRDLHWSGQLSPNWDPKLAGEGTAAAVGREGAATGLLGPWGDPSCTAWAHPKPKPTHGASGEQSPERVGSTGLLRGEPGAEIPGDGQGSGDLQGTGGRGGSPAYSLTVCSGVKGRSRQGTGLAAASCSSGRAAALRV